MKLRSNDVYLAAGGVRSVRFLNIVSRAFGISEREAREHLEDGSITIDDQVAERKVLPVDEVAGCRVAIGGIAVEVEL